MTRAEKITQAETQLAEVQAAISKILTGGQAYGAEGRTRQNADLTQLQERETMLERKLASLRRNGAISTYGVAIEW